MREDREACGPGEEARFTGLSAGARPFSRSEQAAFSEDLKRARDRETIFGDRAGADDLDLRRATFDKWRILHEWIRRHPYRDRPSARRSEMWREGIERFRTLRDPELIDWLVLQIEVAANIENGVLDMPHATRAQPGSSRSNTSPTAIARRLRSCTGRKPQAGDGCFTVDSEWHARSAAILGGEPPLVERGEGGHEGVPFVLDGG